LLAEEIPLIGRIVAVADVFDALMSKRIYKRAYSIQETLEILNDSAGRHLDPELVRHFLKSIDQVIEITNSFNEEEVGEGRLLKLA
jgi:putative two-component system response regulator